MADSVTPRVRSQMMAGIRGTNTKPELVIRSGLHRAGFRFRLHDSALPGRPDLVFPRWRAVLFVNGCFWHGHDCHLFKWPKSREEFWRAKIEANRKRDQKAQIALTKSGWRVGTVWECAIKGRNRQDPRHAMTQLGLWLTSSETQFELAGINDKGGHHGRIN